MAWKEEHIHVHTHCNNSEIVLLLKDIKALLGNGDQVKQLEKQMDGWLASLNQAFGKLEQVSEQVDSTK